MKTQPPLPKKILIVDDEKLARQRIQRFLRDSQYSGQAVEAENGLAVLTAIRQASPDLVFLDIQMPGLDGFQVLQQLENRNFQIIFQTAYDEFAVQAFEESAVDYLLKPFTLERFRKAFAKAATFLAQREALQRLNDSLQRRNIFLDCLTYKLGGQLRILRIDEILYFISRDHCTSAFTVSGEHIVDLSISYLASHLDPKTFFRCHRNCIVALNQISSIAKAQDYELALHNGLKLPVSRSSRRELVALISN